MLSHPLMCSYLRDTTLAAAYGVLLSGHEETDIMNFFIESAFPSREEVEQVLAALHSEPAGAVDS